MSQVIDWILSHITWMIGLLFIIFFSSIMITVSQYNRFEYTADQVISRSGGLTKSAYKILKDESEQKYHDMFQVSVHDLTKMKPNEITDDDRYNKKPADYGADVTYYIQIKVPFNVNLGSIHVNNYIRAKGARTIQNEVRLDPDGDSN